MAKPKIWSVLAVLNWLSEYFKRHNIKNSRFEAEQLLAYVLDCPRLDLYLKYDQPLSKGVLDGLKSLIKKRVNGLSLSYITGKSYFWKFELAVDQSVLVPRKESEILIQAVLDLPVEFLNNQKLKILDFGTGSGALAIALALELPSANILAVDISKKALALAKRNIEDIQKLFQTTFVITLKESDKFADLGDLKFDIIIANPPYIKSDELKTLDLTVQSEPALALDGGAVGLDFYNYLAENAASRLNDGGILALEHGADQKSFITEIFDKQGKFAAPSSYQDYAGNDRVLVYGLGDV